MRTSGILTCQAAAFIYKADASAQKAWNDIESIKDIRRELHGSKTSLLDALKAWNIQPHLDPDNSFLAIYAHMGEPGIAPVGSGDPADVISWSELASALPRGVTYGWLIGCNSEHALKHWPAPTGPVRLRLLVTDVSEYWGPLLRHFHEEISLDPIRFPEEMPELLKTLEPSLGGHLEYYESTSGGWRPSFLSAP